MAVTGGGVDTAPQPEAPHPGPGAPTRRPGWHRWALVALMVVAVVLRLWLAWVNTEANDAHIEVSEVIADEGRIPGRDDLWEGSQAKLYHLSVAGLWEITGTEDPGWRTRSGQLLSCAAGLATIAVAWRFLRRAIASDQARLATFALVALSPPLITTSVQVTNDAWVILFCALALDALHGALTQPSRRGIALVTLWTALACLSKGSGFLVAGVVVVALAAAAWLGGRARSERVEGRVPLDRRRAGIWAAAFLIGVLVPAALFGPYVELWRTDGDPFQIAIDPNPRPGLLSEGAEPDCTRGARWCWRPGTTSVVATFVTFRPASLWRNPVTTNGPTDYAAHRISLWSQLYGSAQSTSFAQWPPSWQDDSVSVRWLNRGLLVAGTVPTLILLGGLVAWAGRGLRWLGRRGRGPESLAELSVALAGLASLAFIARFTFLYRDFGNMKALLVLPGLVGLMFVFADTWRRLTARYPAVAPWLMVNVGLLATLYALDATVLGLRLT